VKVSAVAFTIRHARSNWSYEDRELRANLVYRDFTRVGAEKMPGAKTVGVACPRAIHKRIVTVTRDEV
jgi:transposase, IS5 family